MDTTEDVLNDIKPFAGANGTCNDVVALEFLNKARRLLWNKLADFAGTMEYVRVSCANGCFYLPSAYSQVRLAWFGNQPVSIGDEWYTSIPQVGLPAESSCHSKLMQLGGFHVTFRNYDESPYEVGFQTESLSDVGTKVTFFGIDEHGTSKKEEITLGVPATRVLSTNFFQGVTAVIKPRTDGRIRMYAVDRQAKQFMLLAIYQPYDKNPQFRKYSIQGAGDREITVYAKKTFFDIISSNELVEFPTEALKFAVSALVAQRDRDLAAYTNNLSIAVAECNRETANSEIATASPMRLFHEDHPEALIRY